jgi:hypothetical protein
MPRDLSAFCIAFSSAVNLGAAIALRLGLDLFNNAAFFLT